MCPKLSSQDALREPAERMSAPQLAQLVELLLGVATTLIIVWIAAPGHRPWRIIIRSVWSTIASRRRVLYLAACFSILVINYLYLVLDIDRAATEFISGRCGGEDFTHLVHAVEGEAVARFHAAVHWLPLTYFLGYVYVVVFPCLVFVLIFVFDHLRSARGLALVLIGYVLNYLFVLPFYLCAPVREVFHYYRHDLGSRAVTMRLDEISPAIMEAYRSMSGLDNCFPSFHTSLAVTMALVSWHAGRRTFAAVVTFLAVSIVVSTVYLGVHWLIDVGAGLVVGVVAYVAARWLSRRWAAGVPKEAAPAGDAALEA